MPRPNDPRPNDRELPAASGAERPVASGAERPVASGAERPVASGAERPVASGAERPVASGAERPVASGAERPVASPAERPVASPAERPVASPAERRRHTRFKVAPMYTTVHVRRGADGDGTSEFDGHVYDISEGGIRFEIDEALPEGAVIEVEIGLPGCRRLIEASGKVVRVNAADDDPGPRRMALMFDRFADPASREALRAYLDQRWLERAA